MRYKNFYCNPQYSDAEKTYYGKVNGQEELGMVEAATLEDLEILFHAKVDDFTCRTSSGVFKWTTNVLMIVLGLVILFSTLAITCPDRDDHMAVISDRISFILNETIGAESKDLDLIDTVMGNKLLNVAVGNFFTVDNYFLFSVGRFSFNGETNRVTVGVLGHVFASSREKIRQKIDDDPEMQEILKRLR